MAEEQFSLDRGSRPFVRNLSICWGASPLFRTERVMNGERRGAHVPDVAVTTMIKDNQRGSNHHAITSDALPLAVVPSAMRLIFGGTALDNEVDELTVPARPRWLCAAVRALRWYRRVRPPVIGQRCVWDPSCSRYAELALRQRGAVRGAMAALVRLWRCRPNKGGVDRP